MNKMNDKIIDSILKKYFTDNSLIDHQIDSYNEFIDIKVPQIINQYNPVTIYHNFNEELNMFDFEIFLYFKNFKTHLPCINENNGERNLLTPNEARCRSITYASNMYVDLEIVYKKNIKDSESIFTKKLITNVSLGQLPIMVKSKLCIFSQKNIVNNSELGGYFIINGNEKVVITQERTAENKVLIFKRKKTSLQIVAEVKSSSYNTFLPTKHIQVKLFKKKNKHEFFISMPNLKKDIPIMILLKFLGLKSDKHLIDLIKIFDSNLTNKELEILTNSFNSYKAKTTTTSNLLYDYTNIIGTPRELLNNDERISGFLNKFIKRNYLPHVSDCYYSKLLFTIYMITRLLNVYFNKEENDDRDSYFNKRLDTTGTLLSYIFRMNYTKLLKDTRNTVIKELNNSCWKKNFDIINVITNTNIYKVVKSTTIDTGLKYSLATGNWGQKIITNKMGIAQVLSRLNIVSTLSHLRRVCSPVEKTGKILLPRKLHTTQWGFICPVETPEGASIGIVKNLALGSNVTRYFPETFIVNFIKNLKNFINFTEIENCSLADIKVYVNGKLIGLFTDNFEKLYNKLLDQKRSGVFSPITSILKDKNYNSIRILTSGGRCIRPLFIVKNNTICNIDIEKNIDSMTWLNFIIPSINLNNDFKNLINNSENKELHSKEIILEKLKKPNFIKKSIIEFIDQEEQNQCLIAINNNKLKDKINYSHCEIDQSLLLSICACLIPFPDHNQSPRNTYQSAMCKQAMGLYSTNFNNRFDTLSYILYYPQLPIVRPKVASYLNIDKNPFGMNCIVAIASYTGYNQEDSIIMNKASLDRGLLKCTYYKTYKDEELRDAVGIEKFMKPDKQLTFNMKPYNYNKLNDDGYVEKNTYITSKDVIIGKAFPIKNSKNQGIQYYQDSSTTLKKNEEGYVDNVYTNKNGEGYNFIKFKIRMERRPVVGDKFSSRHGQKGTVGAILNSVDMPFSSKGYKPDLIINPHAIPSRMTIGQLLESILTKTSVIQGKLSDASPFKKLNVDDIYKVLKENDFEEYGDDVLYNGITGKKMECKIFICPTYYQRLKHMVKNKIHSRTSGPVVSMTRQPAEGRTRDGGLRFGEMEKDCMISHGNMQFLKEKFLECSDKFTLIKCNTCGNQIYINTRINNIECKNCNNTKNFNKINFPYSTKLLNQELNSMAISMKFH